MKSFTDKVAAVTGAGSGIGRALAAALAAEGCHLALADKDETGLAETAAMIRAAAPATLRLTTRQLDVADRAAMHAWADEVATGRGRVNLIFNNAGVALSSTIEGMSYDDLEWIFGINFWGVVHGTKAFLPHLKAAGEGHVVNISSIFGIFSQPGMAAYNATKFAVRGFTESLRQELDLMDCGVSATCVHPGGIKTAIARSSRVSSNLDGFLVQDADQGRQQFEKLFRTSADKAAAVILDGVRRDKRRVLIGPDAYGADLMARLLPAAYQAIVVRESRRMQRQNLKAAKA